MVIAMLGNVFSPGYYAARQRGRARAIDFVAVNVALYGPGARRWVMTERAGAVREARALSIGRSSFAWQRDSLDVRLDETCAPWPRPLRGRVLVHPEVMGGRPRVLDSNGRHQWCPIAPLARVEVALSEPALAFRGAGYLDSNVGAEPLEEAFRSWSWSRFATKRGASVFYDVEQRDGTRHELDAAFDRSGSATSHARSVARDLGASGWGVRRPVRSAGDVEVVRKLEDTPFYSRTQVRMSGSAHGEGVHESLDLDRFQSPWVRALIPMRMRRES